MKTLREINCNIGFIVKSTEGFNENGEKWTFNDFSFLSRAFKIAIKMRLFLSSTYPLSESIKDEK